MKIKNSVLFNVLIIIIIILITILFFRYYLIIKENIKLSNNINELKNTNEILNEEINVCKAEINKLKKDNEVNIDNKTNTELFLINYIEYDYDIRFVEDKGHILSLPTENSLKLNSINTNSILYIFDAALVENETWLYVEIPVLDSPTNIKGWIKETDTVRLTENNVKNVQSNVTIVNRAKIYEVEDFEKISSTTYIRTDRYLSGRLEEKKEGYVRITLPGGNSVWVEEKYIKYPTID